MKTYVQFLLIFVTLPLFAQTGSIRGKITEKNQPVPAVSIIVVPSGIVTAADDDGNYEIKNIPFGTYEIIFSSVGLLNERKKVTVNSTTPIVLNVVMHDEDKSLEEVVITGTMKEVSRSDSPIPVEIITPKLFKKNPTASLFEAVGMVNGVQPQLNCNVCNTGDIHINGMEGPYTMILIDG